MSNLMFDDDGLKSLSNICSGNLTPKTPPTDANGFILVSQTSSLQRFETISQAGRWLGRAEHRSRPGGSSGCSAAGPLDGMLMNNQKSRRFWDRKQPER